jgi:hypothetical protein
MTQNKVASLRGGSREVILRYSKMLYAIFLEYDPPKQKV